MKTTDRAIYTAKEVIEILQKAKELGVIEMRLEGFEASFHPQENFHESHSEKNIEFCKCGARKTMGRYGLLPLCNECYAQEQRDAERARFLDRNGNSFPRR